MTVRDRALVAALAVLFVASSAVALAPTIGSSVASVSTPQPSAARPGRYVEGVLGHASNASPFGARTAADRMLDALIFRGLVRLGPDQTLVGDLAASWETDPSGGQWTFHLRPGMQWQDGQPITADDVAFTISALADPTYTGPDGASWRDVTATVVDPLTVTLKLATPLGGFLQAATQPIAPRHLLAAIPPANLPDASFGLHPIGSGPFRLVSLDSQRAVLDASGADGAEAPASAAVDTTVPSSGGASATASAGELSGPSFVPVGSPGSGSGIFPAPRLAGIEFRYFDDPAVLRAAWDRGELDAASELPAADAAALAAATGARALRYPSSSLLAVVLNLRTGATPFGDPAVRKALLEAIDRDSLLATTLDGFGSVASSLIPSWSPMFDASASPHVAYDPTAARAALAAAGWKPTPTSWIPNGASTELHLTLLSADAASNPTANATAEAVASAWRSIGLDVTHEAVPAASLVSDQVEPGRFQAAVVPLVIGLDPDLYPLLASSQARTGGANVAGVQDGTLDKLLNAARAPGADAQRLAAYAALQQQLTATTYLLPLEFRDEVVVLRDTVQGPVARPVGGPGDRFWDVLGWRLADSPASS